MNIYPNIYFTSVLDIKIEFLIKNKIKVLILDVDNTLIDYYKKMSDDVVSWAKELQGQGIRMYILSNTNKKQKVEDVAKKLEIPYEMFAKKPFKKGFLKIRDILKTNEKKYCSCWRSNIYRCSRWKQMQYVYNFS